MFKYYRERRWICWIANLPILNNAQDPATNTGAAITSKRVSIIDNPLYKSYKFKYRNWY